LAFNFWEVNFRVVKFRVIKVTIAALFLTLFCTATFPSQVFAANDILLHSGGSVLTNPTPYLIFYGDWSDTASATAFTQMLSDYANSARFQMLNERYFGIKAGERYQIGKLNVSPANYTFLNYGEMEGLGESETLGTDLISASLGIDEIVAYAIKAKFKSFDPNGIYLVLTSADFKMFDWSGNEMSDCGWNSYNNSPEISPEKYNYIWAGEAGTELEQATCQFDPKITQKISAGYATVTNKVTAASYKSNQSQTINLSYPNNVSNTFGSLENVAIH
jgi:hypothetical protein